MNSCISGCTDVRMYRCTYVRLTFIDFESHMLFINPYSFQPNMNTYFKYPYSAIRNKYDWPQICITIRFLINPIRLKPSAELRAIKGQFEQKTGGGAKYVKKIQSLIEKFYQQYRACMLSSYHLQEGKGSCQKHCLGYVFLHIIHLLQ